MKMIRYSKDATICITYNDETCECSAPTQDDMDTLPVGDMTKEITMKTIRYSKDATICITYNDETCERRTTWTPYRSATT